ncbi:hypothetical protein AVEN_71470-1 [Araneus ventricosus]|uniref:Uncharacterized protein n=1 Tax=Araneus ventricosus TaxID=182803 RepID=A0A4Y2CU85_ARAVE|nr:hypothetical protein AVEN_71470-1 [Araneus ventricosus]
MYRILVSVRQGKKSKCKLDSFQCPTGQRWPSGKVWSSGPGSKPDSIAVHVGLLHVKSYGNGSNVLPLVWWGSLERGCQFRCRPRHLTAIQKDEVRPKQALVLLQNRSLIYHS